MPWEREINLKAMHVSIVGVPETRVGIMMYNKKDGKVWTRFSG